MDSKIDQIGDLISNFCDEIEEKPAKIKLQDIKTEKVEDTIGDLINSFHEEIDTKPLKEERQLPLIKTEAFGIRKEIVAFKDKSVRTPPKSDVEATTLSRKSIKKAKGAKKDWFTEELMQERKIQEAARKAFLKNKTPESEQKFRKLQRAYNANLKKARDEYYYCCLGEISF